MNNDITILTSSLDELGIKYTDEQIDKLIKYFKMLIEKNKVLNLTAITDFQGVMIKHFVDSLSILKYIEIEDNSKVLDIGTGAGFPGIPLKIFLPEVEFLLMDSLNKRLNFILEVIDELKLEKISVMHGRAEDLAHDKEYRENFDFCFSRAVANLSTLSELCLGFVKKGGMFIPYKSALAEDEISNAGNAIKLMGGKFIKTEKFELPVLKEERDFVFIKKGINTPGKYPRKAGTPAKNPL